LLTSHDQEFSLDIIFEFRKRCATEEAEESSLSVRTLMISSLAEWLGLIDDSVKVSENTDSSE
jgi:hypothetical protein